MADANSVLAKVIEYLSKKGYSRTESMLRVESANQDAEGKPISTKVEDGSGARYTQALGERRVLWSPDFADRISQD